MARRRSGASWARTSCGLPGRYGSSRPRGRPERAYQQVNLENREDDEMTIGKNRKGMTRRRLLQGAAMAGAAAAIGPRFSLADEGKTLRVRVYSDIQNLDPGFRVSEPDSEVMYCIFAPMAMFMPNVDGWEAEPLAAKTLKQLDATHVAFELNPGIM